MLLTWCISEHLLVPPFRHLGKSAAGHIDDVHHAAQAFLPSAHAIQLDGSEQPAVENEALVALEGTSGRWEDG